MLGVDRPLEEQYRAVIDAMARSIREVDRSRLITFRPVGCSRTTQWVLDADYIDFHTAQTGHAEEMAYESDQVMLSMAGVTDKPYMDSESRYEDHPACFDETLGYFWNCDDMRQNAYWNLMTGVYGQTYGNRCVWSMTREPTAYFPFAWKEALLHERAEQIHHLKDLRLSRDFASFRHAPELIVENYDGMGHMAAAHGSNYGYVYSPRGRRSASGWICLKGPDACARKDAGCAVGPGKGMRLGIDPGGGIIKIWPEELRRRCLWELLFSGRTDFLKPVGSAGTSCVSGRFLLSFCVEQLPFLPCGILRTKQGEDAAVFLHLFISLAARRSERSKYATGYQMAG